MNGTLYIIPIPISETEPKKVLSEHTIDVASHLRCFVVEKTKTARQFLRKIDKSFPIDDSEFYELNKHEQYAFEDEVIEKLLNRQNVGLMSEAGYPGIADPGSSVVKKAHKKNINVVSLIGPSSIFLALATSGLNGQSFTFNGYLPKNESERVKKIKHLNQLIRQNGFAQIFIETPYRNQAMFNDLIKHSFEDTLLTIAEDITGQHEWIKTKTINDWKTKKKQLPKIPCVFILGN
jgi:16S rRNA (cytidine1402-2'-O)-methyltransferase